MICKLEYMDWQKLNFKKQIKKAVSLKYILHLPSSFSRNKKWPLIVFLHGSEERGDDLDKLTNTGLAVNIKNIKNFPFVVLSPQLPADMIWLFKFDDVRALIEEIENKYSVDPGRIYLTGISLGGDGVWHYASFEPERYAAIVPIAASPSWFLGFPEKVKILKDLPVWIFHGIKDEIVPVREAKTLLNILLQNKGNVKHTFSKKHGHNIWTYAYKKPELYQWLLKQKIKK